MRCKCEATRHRFWGELVDSVTMRHGYKKITWRQMQDSLTDAERLLVRFLADLERKPPRDIYDTLAGYLVLETAAEERDRVIADEIVPLDVLLRPVSTNA